MYYDLTHKDGRITEGSVVAELTQALERRGVPFHVAVDAAARVQAGETVGVEIELVSSSEEFEAEMEARGIHAEWIEGESREPFTLDLAPNRERWRGVWPKAVANQEIRLAKMFATEPAAVRRMTFANVAQPSRRFIATRPTQVCTSCSPGHTEPEPILRSQLLGWRITCPLCGDHLRDAGGRELASPFRQYRTTALRGEKLLDDEVERGIGTWTSPAEIARLLLMRRIPRPIPRESDLWRFRVLGAIIPDLDRVVGAEQENLPTPAKPILPLHMRPALLAGIAIVERAGPEMLRMLRGHTMGHNRVRFTDSVESMIARTRKWKASSQMHLI